MKEGTGLLRTGTNSDYGSGIDSEDVEKYAEQDVSVPALAVNLVTIGLGTGVLAQAWGIAGASVIPGLFIVGFVLALNFATIMILVHAAERHQQFDLSALMGKIPVFGPTAEVFCYFMTVLSLGMPLIGYYIVLADSLQPFLPDSGLLASRTVVLFLIMCALVPLCFLDQKYLSFTSSVSVVINLDILLLVFAELVSHGPAGNICMFGMTKGTIAFFSAMMFTIVIQMCVLPMYEKLENRTPERFSLALTYAFAFLFFLFGVFALLPYLVYGPYVHSNLLRNLPISLWGNITRLGMVVVISSIFPLLVMPLVSPFPKIKTTALFGDIRLRDMVSLFWAVSLMIPAIFWTDLGFMNVLTGAMSVFGFIGVFPCLAGLYLVDRNNNFFWRASMWALMAFAAIMSGLGLVYTSNNVEVTDAFCIWKVFENQVQSDAL